MGINSAEALRKIEKQGSFLDHYEHRERLLKIGLGAKVDKKANYVIASGCYPVSSLTPLKAVIELLNAFEASYTFLSREVCCGHPVVEVMLRERPKDEQQTRNYENFARQCLTKNIIQAKELGAEAIVTLCCGCNTMWNHYSKNQGLPILHYLDLILEIFSKSRLNREVDFFEGCHQLHNFNPDFQESMTENSKKVLGRVEGLNFREVSNGLCCRISPEKIFASSHTNTVVTPSVCCYSFLTISRPVDGPKVIFLGEILCESLGITGK